MTKTLALLRSYGTMVGLAFFMIGFLTNQPWAYIAMAIMYFLGGLATYMQTKKWLPLVSAVLAIIIVLLLFVQ